MTSLFKKREMSVIWWFFSMKRDSFYVFIWEKWFLVIVIRVVVFFFIHILLRDSEWWIQISHSVKLWWEMRPYTILWSIRISYRIHDFRFFLESGTLYDSCLVGLFSSMWSWMSGWDPTTRICVPTHPWNHMNLLIIPIGTSDKNLASWFELYRICFVTCLASRFLRFSSSSTFVCLVVFWKKEIDGDLAMKMSDHWDTLEHTWCVPAILNLRI